MSDLHNFDLNLLIQFEALISECHVSRAAEKVFLSQSAMSHALARLREHCNDPLLVRTPQGLQPTQRAKAMLPEVRNALATIERAIAAPTAFVPATSQRCFTLAATDYFESVIFPDWFCTLRKRAPHIQIAIDIIPEDRALQRLSSGEVDLIIGLESDLSTPSYLDIDIWCEEHLVVIGSEHYNHRGPLDLPTYLAAEHIAFFDLASQADSAVDCWLAQQNRHRQVVAKVSNYMAGARMAANSQMLATLPKRMAELFATLLPVKIFALSDAFPTQRMTLIQDPRLRNEAGRQWLVDQLKLATSGDM